MSIVTPRLHSSSQSLTMSSFELEPVRDEPVELPPGPAGLLRSAYRMIHEPIEALREWHERYGDTFTVPQPGFRRVMTADPELVRQIYTVRDPELFASVVPESLDVLFGRESVLMQVGQRHHERRKLLMPAFHGERMRSWGEAMAAAGRRAFAGGGEVSAYECTQRATLEVIIRVIFGVDDDERVEEFRAAVTEWCSTLRPGFLFVRALQRDLWGLSTFAGFRRASERVDALLFDQIARTRRSEPGRGDILGSLIEARYDDGAGMSDEEIRDQLRTLLFAGHETTATLLAWALYFVLREPRVRERLLAELRVAAPGSGMGLTGPIESVGASSSIEELARLPYLGAVIDETLRMRPVTTDGFRMLRKPWKLGAWRLPAGVAVSPAVTLIHFRPDLWPEPDQFRPERFLTNERPNPNTYLPFGGGARRCIGAAFARFEACVILATLLRTYELELLDDHVEWGRGLSTLQPLGGVPMRVRIM